MKERIATVDKTSSILIENELNPKIRYGQNFMVSDKIPSLISNHNCINSKSLVIEIGPGIGALTQFLCEKAKKVIAVEIDIALSNILKRTLKDYSNLEVINIDFLKFDLNSIDYFNYDNVVFVSNLPYYITSEILIKLLDFDFNFTVIAMMQKEVANRLLKKEDINDLVLHTYMYSDIKKICDVSKNDFYPKPKVDSSVLKFDKKNIEDKFFINLIIDALFSQRRKTIFNNLKHINKKYEITDNFLKTLLNDNGLKETTRIDELNIGKISSFIISIKNEILLKANAKINIGLKITGKENNYHLLDSIYAPINLFDYILLYPITNDTDVFESNISTIENNSILTSLNLLRDNNLILDHYYVYLYKNIPIGAGLGGGSSDAFQIINKFAKNDKNIDKFIKIIGQDCFFFKFDKILRLKGIDEFNKFDNNLANYHILLLSTGDCISTKDCFDLYDRINCKKTSRKDKNIFNTNNNQIINDLIEPASILNVHIPKLLKLLKNENFDFVSMSGSGNCIYALSKDYKKIMGFISSHKDDFDFIKIVEFL